MLIVNNSQLLPPPQALYLHIPFCPTVCPYCDFHKMRRHEGLVSAYLKRFREEAYALHSEFPTKLKTIYFGGGTPSHLTNDELDFIVGILNQTWGFTAEEITLEADPLTFDAARLQYFKELGFNRLSIGLQSTQDKVLSFLGRAHNAGEGLQAVNMALTTGFNVSADLITAVQKQDTAKDLHNLAQTGLRHISAYNLSIEPYTPFAMRGLVTDENKEFKDYLLTNEILSSYGFERYEVSSHAKRGFESKHNQVYWQGDYFLALGPSAAGFVFRGRGVGERYTNKPIKAWLKDDAPEVLPVSKHDYVLELIMTGLRVSRGIDLELIKTRTGVDILASFAKLIEQLTSEELLDITANHLKATPKGLLQLNSIIRYFYKNHSSLRT